MPVEFALRPRIRLREAPAPARPARARLPKFALPALAYWLAIGGLVYEFVRHHQPSPAAQETALASLAPPPPPVIRPWWRPLPAHDEQATPDLGPPPSVESTAAEPALEPPMPETPSPSLPELEPAAEFPRASDSALDSEPSREPAPRLAKRTPSRDTARSAASRTLAHDPIAALSLPPPAIDRSADELPPLPSQAPVTSAAPSPNAPRPSSAGGLPSCESASESASQDVDFSGGNRVADLPSQAIAAVLENGAWLTSCNVPEHTALEICVAIKGGRVVGASISSRPTDAALNACVKRRASSLQFPYSPHLDVARTRF